MKRTKKLFALSAVTLALAVGGHVLAANAETPYVGSTFGEVWGEVESTPYTALPHQSVSVGRFFSGFHNVLKDAAVRTINNRQDLLPRFDKLLHPNGICLRGTWNITEESNYTGYFAQGRRGLLVARASVALSDTDRGSYRGFGFAGKLFPTESPEHTNLVPTANFFLVDDLGGTSLDHYLDAPMTNEPKVSVRPSSIGIAPIVPFVVSALSSADKSPTFRPLYPIAELGLADPTQARSPHWMMVRGAPGHRADAADFRDELHVASYGGAIELEILVTEEKDTGWKKLGFIELTEDVASDSCDHRLHFTHPKMR